MDNLAHLWIGTYPAEGKEPGSGEGIWQVTLDLRSGALGGEQLRTTTPAPSFLARHRSGRVLYAVGELEEGTVSAFAVDGSRLAHVSTVATGGSFPCHLHATDDSLWVANYGNGVVSRIPLDDRGMPSSGAVTYPHSGSGPVADRQEQPHAHFIHEAPDGAIWVSDLGTDQVRRFTSSGPDGLAAELPPGTGPRHMVALPDGAVAVVGELDSRIHRLAADGSETESQPALRTPVANGQPSQPSHLGVGVSSATRNLLYVATRGPDLLSVFAADGDSLTHVSDAPVGGRWPRHFAAVPAPDDAADFVIVANQYSSTLDVHRVSGTGVVEQVSSMDLPVPSCVLAPV